MKKLFTQKNSYLEKTSKQGFTLIEMIIAVFIFSMSLTALMLMSSKGLQTARNYQKQMTAEYLAIEGIEIVHNIRDKAFLSGYTANTWGGVFQGMNILGSGGCFDDVSVPCDYGYSQGEFYLSNCSNNCIIYNNGNHYSTTANFGAIDTGYRRELHFQKIGSAGKEIEVRSVVNWNNGQVVYTDNLFLWFE